MIFRLVAGTTGLFAGMFTVGSIVSSTYAAKVDRNILKPIRNYRKNFDDLYKFLNLRRILPIFI